MARKSTWPARPPDIGPLYISIWEYLKNKVCYSRHYTVEQFDTAIVEDIEESPIQIVK